MAILNAGIVAPTGGYQISRSLRFNSADSAYLSRSISSTTNRQVWTWSGWVKVSALDTGSYGLFCGWDNSTGVTDVGTAIRITGNALDVFSYINATYDFRLVTTSLYRDPSAWYHFVIAIDTTQATSSNRVKIYVNGIQITAFSTSTYPSLNYNTTVNLTGRTNSVGSIGVDNGAQQYFSGYLTEINFIDGQALTPSSFGETDTVTGVWKPKKYTGSYGTNGFYLNFSDNSGTTSTTLGKDSSGNGNNWTPNNFSVTAGAGNDSLVDTPTNYGTDTGVGGEVRGNYCTLNPLDKNTLTVANGNLQVTGATANQSVRSTIFVSSGKWYYEATITNIGTDAYVGYATNAYAFGGGTGRATWRGQASGGVLNKLDGTDTTGVGTFTTGDVIGCAIDFDSDRIDWYKNNSLTVSYTSAGLASYAPLSPLIQGGGGSYEVNVNFGQRPFAYTAPSGFKALCTQNLPDPVIKDGGDYFNTVLYSGNSGSQSITGVGFQPDLVWGKSRNIAENHGLFDSVRGVNKTLYSNLTNAEATDPGVSAFNSDGFSLNGPTINATGYTYVAWNWKANGAGVTNTAGTITSTVSVNTTSGFSIVTYTGTGSAGTVGHGLGVAPSMVIVKKRSATGNWVTWHTGLTGSNPEDRLIYLDLTNAQTAVTDYWGTAGMTSTTFGVWASGGDNNASGSTFVAYCFAPVAGYSAFGSYTGNGSADGPFVYTGFRPRFLMYKNASAAGTVWIIFDSARNTYNFVDAQLRPNESSAENSAGASFSFDFLSNGFKVRSSDSNLNGSGNTMIYAAFAENPFKLSLAR